jgi:hypothetical protein
MSAEGTVLDSPAKAKHAAGVKKQAPRKWNLIPWYVEAFSSSGVPGRIQKRD